MQMMSMGNGLFMPPIMLPAGMNFQHLRAPAISHFSPLGVGMGIGMGMGLGFGMGMIDLNGSPGLIPVPPLMPGTQFPCPSVPAVAGFHGMPPPSSIHGIPGQRVPMSVPHASPFFNPQAGLSPQSPFKASDKDPSCSNNQRQQCVNLEAVEHANNKEPKGQASQVLLGSFTTLFVLSTSPCFLNRELTNIVLTHMKVWRGKMLANKTEK